MRPRRMPAKSWPYTARVGDVRRDQSLRNRQVSEDYVISVNGVGRRRRSVVGRYKQRNVERAFDAGEPTLQHR